MDDHKSFLQPLLWLSIGYLLFIIAGSLVPFDFSSLTLEEALKNYNVTDTRQLSMRLRSDWFANFLLFIPFTFMLCGYWQRVNGRLAQLLLACTLILFTLLTCMGIEFIQLFLPARVVSINDIVAETLGATAGILLFSVFGDKFMHWYRGMVSERSENRWTLYLDAWLVIIFVYHIMPMDLSLSPLEIFRKWDQGRIAVLPFASGTWTDINWLYGILSDVLLWASVYLLQVKARMMTRARAFSRVMLYALIIEFCQLFVISRFSDTTDLFTAMAGAAVGIWLAPLLIRQHLRSAAPSAWNLWLLCLLGWMFILILISTYPGALIQTQEQFNTKLDTLFSVPLYTYWQSSEYAALTQILRKVLLGVPLGALAYKAFENTRYTNWDCGLALLGLCVFLFFIECLQLAIVDKTPALTDTVLHIGGMYLGFILTRRHFHVPHDDVKGVTDTISQCGTISTDTRGNNAPKLTRLTAGTLFLATFILLWLVSTLPFVPYNVREMFGENKLFSAALLSLAFYWLLGGVPFLFQWLKNTGRLGVGSLLLALAGHLFSGAILARLSFPLESLHDLVGAPVWGSLPELELILRFMFLLALLTSTQMLLLILTGKAPSRDWRFKRVRHFFPVFYMLVILPAVYAVVVLLASTDNLVELLPGFGRSWRVLSGWLYVVLIVGVSISVNQLIRKRMLHVISAAVLVLISAPLGFWLVQLATEQTVIKYQQVFSALSFLLSANREHLVVGGPLFYRFVVAHIVFVTALVVTHKVGISIVTSRTQPSLAAESRLAAD